MEKSLKTKEITEISALFGKAKAAFLVDFKGMTVQQVTDLRKKLRPLNSEMKVVRNTLARIALKDHPKQAAAISEDFVGTNAVVFAYGDAAASAKLLSEYTKVVEKFQLKSGVLDGARLAEDQVKYLATLPSKDVLRAQFLGLLQAPMSKFLAQLQAPASGFVRVLAAQKEKQA